MNTNVYERYQRKGKGEGEGKEEREGKEELGRARNKVVGEGRGEPSYSKFGSKIENLPNFLLRQNIQQK